VCPFPIYNVRPRKVLKSKVYKVCLDVFKRKENRVMHISKINDKYPVAFKPNNVILKTKNENSVLEHQLLMVLFVIPVTMFPENRQVEIDINLITNKPLHGSICSRIKKAIDNITYSKFEVYQDKTHYEFINVFEKAGRKGNKIIALLTGSAIEAIKKYRSLGFTKIPIEDTLKLKTSYQYIFLEFFLRYEKYKMTPVDLECLKVHAGITADKYPRWIHFKQRVIDPSIAGLNKELGYNIECKVMKTGRTITAITMHQDKKRRKIKDIKAKDKPVNEKAKKEDAEFNFAENCFGLLPSEEKEMYFKKIPFYFGSEVILSTAINNFAIEFDFLLKNNKSPEDFIKAYKQQEYCIA
jgi:plasmid replication initiation protein